MNRTTLMWTVVVLTTTMPLHYLTLHCSECVVSLHTYNGFHMRRLFHFLSHSLLCLFLFHSLSILRATAPQCFNVPKTVTLHQLIVSLSEHYVVWLIRYSVVDPSLYFVFDLTEIRWSVLVCWCPISRHSSIPVEWAVSTNKQFVNQWDIHIFHQTHSAIKEKNR